MQNNEIKVNDKFILHSSNGEDYKIIIYNINYFRPPEATIAFLLYDKNGEIIRNKHDELWFVGEGFFIMNEDKLERIRKHE